MQSFKVKINGKWLTGFQDPKTRSNGIPDPDVIMLSSMEEDAMILGGAFNVGCTFKDIAQNMRYYHNVEYIEKRRITPILAVGDERRAFIFTHI